MHDSQAWYLRIHDLLTEEACGSVAEAFMSLLVRSFDRELIVDLGSFDFTCAFCTRFGEDGLLPFCYTTTLFANGNGPAVPE